MKFRIFLISLLFLLPLGLKAQSLPVVDLVDAEGKTVSTTSLINHKEPFAITFWASWCKFCIEELEAITDMSADWKKPVRIYAVCEDDARSVSRAKVMASSSEWPATVLYDTNSKLSRELNVSSIPHAFVFDKDGKLIYSHLGYIPGDEEELINKILEAK